MFPETKNAPISLDEIAETAARCREAGAAIAHIHCAPGQWREVVSMTRRRTDILFQAGMSSHGIEQRSDAFDSHPDMISVMLGQHDEAFTKEDVYVIHTREELLAYAEKCRKSKVKPEFEVWHHGSIWTLEYLISKGALDKPYWLTLFFGWPGGNWTPITVEELVQRSRSVPLGSLCSVSAMGRNTWDFIAAAVLQGDHIRVGTEDCPFDIDGSPAVDNVQLVKRALSIVEALGKKPASPEETRSALSIQR